MHVRPGTLDDREFILSLAERFAEPELPPWRNAVDVANGTRHRLAEGLDEANERSAFILAEEEDGTRAGFAWMRLMCDFYTLRDIAKLEEIAVAQDGSGAAKILMEAFEAWARTHDCDLLVLNVLEANHRARRLYERNGFHAEHTMMTKDLRTK